jgi:hypothetical protein
MKGKGKGGLATVLDKLLEAVRGAFVGPAPALRPIPVRRPAAPQRDD